MRAPGDTSAIPLRQSGRGFDLPGRAGSENRCSRATSSFGCFRQQGQRNDRDSARYSTEAVMLNSIIERGYLVIQNGTFRHRRHIGFTRQPGALIEEGRATMSPQFTVSPHICSSSNKDGSIILNVERGLLYSLIGVGSLMWTKLT